MVTTFRNWVVFLALLCSTGAEAVTRIYMPSTGAAAVSPAVHASWAVTGANFVRRAGVTARISSAMAEVQGTGDATTTTQVVFQYVYGPIAAQSISGTVKGQMRIRRANASGDPGRIAVAVQCVDSAGASPLSLLAPTHSTQTSTPPNLNAIDTPTNRSFEEGNADYNLDLTMQSCPAGGYVVVEVGYKDDSTNLVRFVQLTHGDDSVTDLPEDRTTTTADNPWIEFSQTIALPSAGLVINPLMGGGGAAANPITLR